MKKVTYKHRAYKLGYRVSKDFLSLIEAWAEDDKRTLKRAVEESKEWAERFRRSLKK